MKIFSSRSKRNIKAISKPASDDIPAIGIGEPEMPEKKAKKSKKAKVVLITLLIIILICALGAGGWYFWWTNYATFEYELQSVVVLAGQSIAPEDFLTANDAKRGIIAVFADDELFSESGQALISAQQGGIMEIPLILKLGMRKMKVSVTVYILTPINSITHEYRQEAPAPDPVSFISNSDIARGIFFDTRFTEPPLPFDEYEVGEHTLRLSLNGVPFEVSLIIADTTKPTATTAEKEILIGETVQPEDFILDMFDYSQDAGLSVSFAEEPNVLAHEDQDVRIIIEDIYGNYDIFTSRLKIQINDQPPTLLLPSDVIESTLGDPVSYRLGVAAYDSFGRDLSENIIINTENVDVNTVSGDDGYTATYTVTDFTGLLTSAQITVYIIDVDIEWVNTEVDKILGEIFTENMTQVEQARAIVQTVRRTVAYDLDMRWRSKSVYEAAYRALRDRRGNCFYFASLAEVMLTRAGIENMRIQRRAVRSDGFWYATTHVWSLINPDGLGWHHFDAFGFIRERPDVNAIRHFFTQKQCEMIDDLMAVSERYGGRGYYDYDPSLYDVEIVYE
ncbi:MAG: hypothetical protein FWH17_04080 [Oscillospiraceae bacterium]|nr:hypothetical protein [Oscillospiraceae bacterium]